MHRRAFIGAVTSALVFTAAPFAAAQTSTTVRRIGWLSPGVPWAPAFTEGRYPPLKELGWIKGRNLLIEERYANNNAELLRPLAEELVRLNVELIVTEGTDATRAAKNATKTIPIIMYSAGDPVRTGLVASLGRPGGNVTGYSIVGTERDAKSLSLLRELLPGLQRVGVLTNSASSYSHSLRHDFEQACRSIGIQPIFVEVAAPRELAAAVADVARQRGQALIVENDRLFYDNRVEIMRTAMSHALPTQAEGKEFLEAGALVSYSFSLVELRRRGAAFIDKILRGARPADLPIEQATQFELGINLKAAKELGITVPQSLLLRADVVIQ